MTTYEINSVLAYWIQALAAIGTLVVVVLAYNKFLPQKLAESQLTLVLELIKVLADSKYHFEQVDKNRADNPGSYAFFSDTKNAFELAMLYSRRSELLSLPVFLPSNYSTVFSPSPFSYIGNPLLPDSIAKSMNKLRRNLIHVNEDLSTFNKYIIIGNKRLVTRVKYAKEELYQLEGGINSLVESCEETTQEIIKWLNRYGLKDLNFLVLQPESENLFHSHFPEL